jgi:hypothetical protein
MIHEITSACAKCPHALACLAGKEPVRGIVVCPTCNKVQVLRVGQAEIHEVWDLLPICVQSENYSANKLKGAFENAIRRVVKRKREEVQRFSYSHVPVVLGKDFLVTLCEECATELINEVHNLIFGPGAGPGGSLF